MFFKNHENMCIITFLAHMTVCCDANTMNMNVCSGIFVYKYTLYI